MEEMVTNYRADSYDGAKSLSEGKPTADEKVGVVEKLNQQYTKRW